ncbi:hypothetical protein ACFX1Z_039319 [Malus domestica]
MPQLQLHVDVIVNRLLLCTVGCTTHLRVLVPSSVRNLLKVLFKAGGGLHHLLSLVVERYSLYMKCVVQKTTFTCTDAEGWGDIFRVADIAVMLDIYSSRRHKIIALSPPHGFTKRRKKGHFCN